MLSVKYWNFSPGWQRHLPIRRREVCGLWLPLDTELRQEPWGWRVSRCFWVHSFPRMGPPSPFDAKSVISLLLAASVASSLILCLFFHSLALVHFGVLTLEEGKLKLPRLWCKNNSLTICTTLYFLTYHHIYNTVTVTITLSGRRWTLSDGKPYFVHLGVPRTRKPVHLINIELEDR